MTGRASPHLDSRALPAARSVSARPFPPAFSRPDRTAHRLPDQLAYFSSRGAEVAKPDIATPGMAYSTVPRWNAGDEVEQGTSMAAPHASGLAALLVSGLAQAHKPIDARAIKQALMVTASPTPGMTYLDEGTGIPDVVKAWTWLEQGHVVPNVRVRAIGLGDVSAAVRRALPSAHDTVQTFELIRPASAPPASYTLRSDSPWLTAPNTIVLKGERTRVEVRYAKEALGEPGARVGVVSGWGEDTLAGPGVQTRQCRDRDRPGQRPSPYPPGGGARCPPAGCSAPSFGPTAFARSPSPSRPAAWPSGRSRSCMSPTACRFATRRRGRPDSTSSRPNTKPTRATW